jgi:hypothetical protein
MIEVKDLEVGDIFGYTALHREIHYFLILGAELQDDDVCIDLKVFQYDDGNIRLMRLYPLDRHYITLI